MRKNGSLYLFMLPYLIVFATFTILPVIVAMYFSFTYFNVLEPPQWTGFDNYVRLFTADDLFMTAFKNTLFFAGDMKDILNKEFIHQHGQPDVIITDPPRAGMHKDVIDTILFAEPKRIVYVSCNPATQARDLAMLDEKYKVTGVRPVDMFPHTQHVENVVVLDKR